MKQYHNKSRDGVKEELRWRLDQLYRENEILKKDIKTLIITIIKNDVTFPDKDIIERHIKCVDYLPF